MTETQLMELRWRVTKSAEKMMIDMIRAGQEDLEVSDIVLGLQFALYSVMVRLAADGVTPEQLAETVTQTASSAFHALFPIIKGGNADA